MTYHVVFHSDFAVNSLNSFNNIDFFLRNVCKPVIPTEASIDNLMHLNSLTALIACTCGASFVLGASSNVLAVYH